MTRILTVPGLNGSGPRHWQSIWERLDGATSRVEQADWDAPELGQWSVQLDAEVAKSMRPTVLVGHSLGAVLIAHWASRARASQVIGALLVAPADVEQLPPEPPSLASFAPIARVALPFPAIVVASQDDPYAELSRARSFADSWGARFVDLGALGHINADSALDTWPAGRSLLRELCARAPFALDPRLAASCFVIGEGALSQLLLMNDARYPWCILVPKRSAISESFELDDADQRALARESAVLAAAMAELFGPDKLNVAALGNVVRQLHVHHVVRRLDDPAWPGPVWGHSPAVPYAAGAEREVAARLFSHVALSAQFSPAI